MGAQGCTSSLASGLGQPHCEDSGDVACGSGRDGKRKHSMPHGKQKARDKTNHQATMPVCPQGAPKAGTAPTHM